MGEMQRQGVVPGFEPSIDEHQNDATTGDTPTNIKPGFEIPSWANSGMPGQDWPKGTRTSEEDCNEQTAKFRGSK